MPAQRSSQGCRNCSCRSHGCRLEPLGFATLTKRVFYAHQADDRTAKAIAARGQTVPPVDIAPRPEQSSSAQEVGGPGSTQTAGHDCTFLANADEMDTTFLDVDRMDSPASAAEGTSADVCGLPTEGAELQQDPEDPESQDGISEPLYGLPEDATAPLDEVMAPQVEEHGRQLLEAMRNGTAVHPQAIQAILFRPTQPQPRSQWANLFFHMVIKLSRTVPRADCELLLRYMGTILCEIIPGASDQDRIMTMASVYRRFGLTPEGIVRFAVCPRCRALYVVALRGPQPHTSCTMCAASGQAIDLFKQSPSSSVPRVSFLYQSVISWLSWLLNRPGIEDQLQRFRTAWTENNPDAADAHEGLPAGARNVRLDLWDGNGWDSDYAESDVLNLYATFGYDAFNPFQAQSTSWHSTGALVITIASLPPDLRYRQENCLLVGCIPGPTEPSVDSLFHFLEPLIAELAQLEAGIPMSTWNARCNGNPISSNTSPVSSAAAASATRMVRLRLLNFVGDTPARAKVGGFPSHLVHGEFCPSCRIAYTDRATAFEHAAQARDPEQHRFDSLATRDLGSQARIEAHIRATGARFSALYLLPYWRSVTQMPMDSMHMLHLGLTKTLWHKVLLLGGLFSQNQVAYIQQSIASSYLPSSEFRPDRRLGDLDGGSGTAEQWSALARIYLPFSTLLLEARPRSETLAYRWDP